MKFQGRGNVYLAEVVDGVPGPYKLKICPDSYAITLATESFEHINKCGPVDVPDYRGQKSLSGTVTFSFSDLEDRNFALATLGTVNEGASGTVTAEELPVNIEAGDFYFLGGTAGHQNITSLVIGSLVLDTDYTLDAASGRVTFLTDQVGSPVLTAGYSYDDEDSVAMLTASQKEYAARFEYINKANGNNPGSLELYRIRFDPAGNLDFLSDELQIPELSGTVLADQTRETADTEFGQFGRRIL